MFSVSKKLTSIFTDIANAIRIKTGISGPIKADNFPDILEGYYGDKMQQVLNKTLRTILSEETYNCSRITYNAFRDQSLLTSVNFPICTLIDDQAFYSCSALNSISFPTCVSIGSYAFAYCSFLQSINFPSCTTIGDYAFQGCYSLKTVDLPIFSNAILSTFFTACNALTEINAPICRTVSNSAFQNRSFLTSINFPACRIIGSYAFRSCFALKSVNFPLCAQIETQTFYYCKSLSLAIFSQISTIKANAFANCFNLISLYIFTSSICTLSNSNVFYSTPINGYSISANRYGSIFVPTSLVNSYKTATNWSYFSSYIFAIEDYPISI